MSGNGGRILQHMEYLPFGEAMMDEQINSRNSPFKYNGKHLDEETGNYYYGARYYDPKLSNFISVDPLAEETMSPYGYCYNNPINLIDPDGMAGVDPIKGLKKLWNAMVQTVKDDFSKSKVKKFERDVIQPVSNALKATAKVLKPVADAGKKLDKMLTGTVDKSKSKQGGYDLRSDLKKGETNVNFDGKRQGGRDVEVKDVTGFDAMGELSSGMTDNKTRTLSDYAEKLSDGMGLRENIDNASSISEEAATKRNQAKNDNPEDIYNISYDKKTQNYHYQKKETNEVKKQNE